MALPILPRASVLPLLIRTLFLRVPEVSKRNTDLLIVEGVVESFLLLFLLKLSGSPLLQHLFLDLIVLSPDEWVLQHPDISVELPELLVVVVHELLLNIVLLGRFYSRFHQIVLPLDLIKTG